MLSSNSSTPVSPLIPSVQGDIHALRSEGDINLSPERQQWRDEEIDSETRVWLDEDERYFIPQSLSTPCLNVLTSSEGIYLHDLQGRKIMDFHGNNVHQVGFRNPSVLKAIHEQLTTLPFCSRRYTNLPIINLAKKLTSLAPGDLNKLLFAPSASLAIGMALKLARVITGKFKTLSMWDSFHGASLDALSVGGESVFRSGMGPLLAGSEHLLPWNSYRCIYSPCQQCGLKCIAYLEYVLSKERDVGAIIVETIRNTDVQIPSLEYYQQLREICDRYKVLLILDETAIAFGRTGKMFAFEHYGIIPDMVVIGKGLGGGVLPLAALIARESLIQESLEKIQSFSLGHYTHEKNPLAAAAGLAMITFIEEHDLLNRTHHLGLYFVKKLMELKERFPLIGDLRGRGLLFAVELVKDHVSKTPASTEASQIMYESLKRGLSFKVSQGNVLTLSPPLIITKEQLDEAVEILAAALSKHERIQV